MFKHGLSGGEEQTTANDICEAVDIDKAFLTAIIVAEIIDWYGLISEFSIRQCRYFDHVHMSCISEETEPISVHTLNDIFVFSECGVSISFKSWHIDSTAVTETVHQENNFNFFEFLFFENCFFGIDNLSPSWTGIRFTEGLELFCDHPGHAGMILQNIFIFGNIF